MALTPGTRLGAYEVTAQIGEGGMGQVYRATDTRLKRQVAIKILPPSLAADPDRLARFQREAEVLASLNHPNIAGIYGLEESGGMTALVMELVEGDDLSQRLVRGAIPVDEALPIARQIADAVEAAHEQGIIHRDLKPANIKVRPDGTVKVLDFGLAKALEPAGNASADLTNSPTITTPAMTQVGIILGTAAYMSPEQAKGRPADKRSDVWAFGCVLFEMLTGRRAFAGADVSETLAAILMREPDWTALPSGIPQHIATVVQRCLQKERKARIPDISAARFLMDEASGFLAMPAAVVAISRRRAVQWKAASVVAVATMLALAGVAFIHFREKAPASPELMRLEVLPPDKTMFQKFAVSPDGRKIAFYAVGADGAGSVWVRSFDSGESRRVAETGPSPSITWSPDSRFVAFPGGEALNKLMKVEASGGPPQTICEIKGIITGGSWNRDGVIIFGSFGGGTWRVSAAGGAASPVTAINVSRQETGHSTPVFLPDGKHFLYLRGSGLSENMGIYLGALDATPEQQVTTRLVATGFSPVYAPSPDPNIGYVLFLRDSALQAQPFDLAKLEMAGEPVPHRRPREEHLRVRVLRRLRQRHPRVPDRRRDQTELAAIDVVRPAGREPRRGCGARVRWLFSAVPRCFTLGSHAYGSFERQLEHLAGRARTEYAHPIDIGQGRRRRSCLVAGRRARGLCLGPFRPHRSLSKGGERRGWRAIAARTERQQKSRRLVEGRPFSAVLPSRLQDQVGPVVDAASRRP